MKITICFSLMLLIICSCGRDIKNSDQNKKIENKIQINDYLTVTIKAKVQEDDIFEIYYAENLENSYIPEDRVQVGIKGSNKFQEIDFKFPKRVYPLKMRIDLGLRRNETDIEIEEIKLSTGEKNIRFSTAEIVEKFRFNKYILHNSETNSFSRKIVDDLYDPIIFSGNLTQEVTEIFSEDK